MKRFLFVVVALVLLLFTGVVFGGGSLLRAGLERGSRAALKTDTRVGGASLNLFGGSVGVSAFRIGNPPGFKSERAFEVGRVAVDASLASLLSDTFVIEKIEVIAPEVTLEVSASGTNLGALFDRLEGKGGAPGGGPAETTKKEGGKKLRVGEVRIAGAKVRIAQSVLGSTERTITIPDLVLREIGSGAKKDETTLARLLEAVLGAIAAAAANTAGDLPQDLRDLLKRETARDALDSVRRDAEGAVKGALEDAAGPLGRQAGDALGDLLRKKEKKE
jgi:uncharacterized protein involved in outer membrane biogenesis